MKKLIVIFGWVAMVSGLAFAGEEDRISADCLRFMAGKGQSWQNSLTACRGGTRVDCLELEIGLWTARGQPGVALNNAVAYCHSRAQRRCVETAAALNINIMIDAHNATLPPGDPGRRALLDPAASLDPATIVTADAQLFAALNQVWNNSEYACRLDQTPSCFMYVYNHYNPEGAQGQAARNAINFAQNQCMSGTRVDCIDLLVTVYGVNWETAIAQCRA